MEPALPAPLVAPEVDCRDLASFMLNVERLMASELVALSPPAVIGSALLLWSRAWKQVPAASLPDDEKVLAAFAKLPVQQFRKLREDVLRGFVKCTDGRLYHRTLGAEATRAYEKKMTFRHKRETDAERLRQWREKQRENGDETPDETEGETRFVPEDTRRDDTKEREDPCRISPAAKPRRKGYDDDFERFWRSYPTDRLMSKSEAFKAWAKLAGDDRTAAAAAVPAFIAECRRLPDYRTVHACRFLSQRRFEGFALGQPNGHAAGIASPSAEKSYDLRGGLSITETNLRAMIARYRASPGMSLAQWGSEADLRGRTPAELAHVWDEPAAAAA